MTFQELMEYISDNFAMLFGHQGAATHLVCQDHDIFYTCHGHLTPFGKEMMSEIGKHMDEKHPELKL